MNLYDLIERKIPPVPWAEGEKIPWHEAEFSKRMLKEHLSQAHDAASRREVLIDQHVSWIHTHILDGKSTNILDLGCGPGLYTSRLAQLGHQCVGIDYAPASIAYAKHQAEEQGLSCQYIEADVRDSSYGSDIGLVMMVHGELNVFRPQDIETILSRSMQALKAGGQLLAEVHTLAAVQALGEHSRNWYSSSGGLFSDQPHLVLEEAFWDEEEQVSTQRYYILDIESGDIKRYAASNQGYSEDGYKRLFENIGYNDVAVHPSLTGQPAKIESPYFVIVAKK